MDYKIKLDALTHGETAVNKKDVMAFLPGVVMMLIILAISSFSTLLQFDFQINEIAWDAFAAMAILRVATMFCSKWIGADVRYKRDAAGDAITTARAEFVELSRRVDTVSFEKWIAEQNRAERIRKAKAAADMRLSRLRDSEERAKTVLMDKQTRRAKKRYTAACRAREREEERATVEWIEQNLSSIHVKVRDLRADDFLVPTEHTEHREVYTVNYMAENTWSVAKGIPFMLLFMLISSMISLSVIGGSPNWISMASDLFSILLNFSTGYGMDGGKTSALTLQVYERRKMVLNRFFAENS